MALVITVHLKENTKFGRKLMLVPTTPEHKKLLFEFCGKSSVFAPIPPGFILCGIARVSLILQKYNVPNGPKGTRVIVQDIVRL